MGNQFRYVTNSPLHLTEGWYWCTQCIFGQILDFLSIWLATKRLKILILNCIFLVFKEIIFIVFVWSTIALLVWVTKPFKLNWDILNLPQLFESIQWTFRCQNGLVWKCSKIWPNFGKICKPDGNLPVCIKFL